MKASSELKPGKFNTRATTAAVMAGLALFGASIESGAKAPAAAAQPEATAAQESLPVGKFLAVIQGGIKKLSHEIISSPKAKTGLQSEGAVAYSITAPNLKKASHHDELIMIFNRKDMKVPISTTLLIDEEVNSGANPMHLKTGESFTFSSMNPTTLKNDPNFVTLWDFWPGGYGFFAAGNGADTYSKKINSTPDSSIVAKYTTQPKQVSEHYDAFLSNAERILKSAQ